MSELGLRAKPSVHHGPPAAIVHSSATRREEGTVALIAALAAMGGLVHLGAAVDHFAEFAPYTAAFSAIAACQVGWAALLLRRTSTRLLLGGCALNAAVAGLWLASRTVGVPIAPHAWVPEPVAIADLVETGSEIVMTLAAWSVAMAPRQKLARSVSERVTPLIVFMLLLCALYGVGAHAG